MSLRKRMLLAAVSGLASWPIMYFLDRADPAGLSQGWWVGYYFSTGAAFGALVLAPFATGDRYWTLRVGSLVLGSILIWTLVGELAVEQYGPLGLSQNASVVVSGVLGALLVGVLLKLLAPLRTATGFCLFVAVAGLFGGLLFSLAWESRHEAVVTSGHIAWQVAVCIALYFGITNTKSMRRVTAS